MASLLLTFTTACSRNNDNNNTPTPTPSQVVDPNQQIVLIWWNLFESEENVTPLIEAYEAANPNVKIQYDQKGEEGGVDSYRNQIDTFLNDGNKLTTPDIFTIHNTWTSAYQSLISPVAVSGVDQELVNDYFDVIKSDFQRNGFIYAMPIYVDSLGIIYNKDKLISSGYTVPENDWSAFQNQAKRLTNRNATNLISGGFSGGAFSNTEFAFDTFNLLMLQNGVKMLNDTGTEVIFATQAEALDAGSFYKDFADSSTGSWKDDQKIDVASFLEKKLAMFAAPSWRLNDVLTYNDVYNIGLNVGVAPMPQLGGGQEIYWADYWGQAVSKDTTNPAVAWDFLQFIAQKQQLKTLDQTVKQSGRKVGIIYPYKSMLADISDSNLSVYAQMMLNAKSWDMYDGFKAEQIFIDTFDRGIDNSKLTSAQSQLNSLRKQDDNSTIQ